MAAENGGGYGCFNYNWASSGNAQWAPWPYAESTIPGFTISNAVAHPLDGSNVMKCDQSQTLPVYGYPNPFDIATLPASAKRWGMRVFGFFYKDANPTSSAPFYSLYGIAVSDFQLRMETDGTVTVWYNDTGGSAQLLAHPAKVFSNATWYAFEMWAIRKDASGVAFGSDRTELFVRCHEGFSSGAAPTTSTDLAHALVGVRTGFLPGVSIMLSNADSFGHGSVNFYYANVYACWEDAANPYGIPRIYYPSLSGTGTLNPAAWTLDYTYWDDSPGAGPDDATTVRVNSTATAAGSANGKATSKITGVPLASIGASDLVIGVSVNVRCGGISLGKAGSAFDTAMLKTSGGTETVAAHYDTHSSNSYQSASWFFKDKPGGTGWSNGDIGTADGTLEVGLDGYSNNVAGGTVITCTSITAEYVWQKNGETVAAVPALVTSLPHRRGLYTRPLVVR